MRSEHRRRAPPTRESLDSTRDRQLHDELRQRLPPEGGNAQPPSERAAADQTGSVTVTVDARGRVTDVDIYQRWRSRLDREGLTGALYEAYTTARQRAFDAFALAALAAEEAGTDPLRIAGEPLDRPADPPRKPPTDPGEWLVWIRERFALIREEVDRAVAASAGEREHTGPHGYLTVTLRASGVVRVVGDASRIWYAETGALREDALAVLSAADRPAA